MEILLFQFYYIFFIDTFDYYKKESFGICNYQFYKTLFNRTIDFDFIFYLAVTCIKLKISFYAVANE